MRHTAPGTPARPLSDHTTTVPAQLTVGAHAFQSLLTQIQRHVDRTPESAEDFDYLGSVRLLLDTFRSLDVDLGALGFFMALGEYLTLMKGAGEPYDDFALSSLENWHEIATPPAVGASFTPGPWRRCGHRQIATAAGAGLPICEVWSGGVGIEQADANECLIAAAPALHAALRAALDVVAGCNADGTYNDQEHAIRAALDLAEGGAA